MGVWGAGPPLNQGVWEGGFRGPPLNQGWFQGSSPESGGLGGWFQGSSPESRGLVEFMRCQSQGNAFESYRHCLFFFGVFLFPLSDG